MESLFFHLRGRISLFFVLLVLLLLTLTLIVKHNACHQDKSCPSLYALTGMCNFSIEDDTPSRGRFQQYTIVCSGAFGCRSLQPESSASSCQWHWKVAFQQRIQWHNNSQISHIFMRRKSISSIILDYDGIIPTKTCSVFSVLLANLSSEGLEVTTCAMTLQNLFRNLRHASIKEFKDMLPK